MSIPTITVNGRFLNAAGDPMSGTLSFRLNAPLVDSVGNVVSERVEIVSTLNASGQITDTNGTSVGLVLYCTSGGDIAPAGLLYDVAVNVGSRPHRVHVAVPSTLGSSVDFADLIPVPASTGVVWTAPTTGGLVDSVNTQTGDVVLDATDVGADPAGTAVSAVAAEAATRASADTTLQTNITAEATARAAADTADAAAWAAAIAGLSGAYVPQSSFTEQVQDIVGALLIAGSGVTLAYDDTAGTLTVSATGGGGGGLTQDEVEDIVSDLIVAGTNVTTTYADNGAGVGTLTIDATSGGLTTEQVQDIVGAMATDSTDIDYSYDDTAGTFTAVIKAGSVTNAMLAGSIALSKLATDPLARANHTGTQLSTTVSDFTEAAQDAVGAMVADTATIDITYTDATPELKADVINDSITFAKVQNIATSRLLGRTTAGTGDVEEMTAATAKTLLAITEADVTNLTTDLAAKAADSAVVHNTGTETIAGKKTFSTVPAVPDDPYDATGWNGSTDVPTKNAVRDKIEALAGGASVDDTAYDATSWDGDTTHAPSKNAVRDKIESMSGGASVDDTAYNAGTWDGVTTVAPSKNAVRDKAETLAPLASPTLTGTPAAPTAAQGTNTTQLATTAYVQTEVGLLIPKSIVDAAGDLIIGTADNTVARMPIGTAGGKAVVADPNDANKISVQYPHGVEAATRGATSSLASTFDRAFMASASVAGGTSGTLTVDRIFLPKGITISSITYWSGTTALSVGTHQWFGLFDSSRGKLALTTDDTSTAWAANTAKTLSFASGFVTTYAGWYYIGCLVTATTVPDRWALSGLPTTGPRNAAPLPSGSSSTGLTDPASCPSTIGAITIGSVLRYGEVS